MKNTEEHKVKFSSEDRQAIIEKIFEGLEREKSTPKNYALTEDEQYFINKFRNLSNKDAYMQCYSLTDEILHILKDDINKNSAIYEVLMQLFNKQRLHVEQYYVAKYLYNKRKYKTIEVVSCLMKFANIENNPEKAIKIFNDNYNNLSELTRDSLYIELIESMLLQNQSKNALNLCQMMLQKLQVEYCLQTKRFINLDTGDDISADDPCWRNNPWLYKFCLSMSLVLKEVYPDSNHRIRILELLRIVYPLDPVTVVGLAYEYRRNKEFGKAINVLINYLGNNPDLTYVWTHYLIILIEGGQFEKAREISAKLYDIFTQQNLNIKKIKILHAWFFAKFSEGKAIFDCLLQDFPSNSMIAYLAIRYAIKIRDEEWKNHLIEKTLTKFASKDKQLIDIIKSLSQARMLSAVLENEYFSPSDLLKDKPKLINNFRQYQIPPVISEAFQLFCSCGTQVCQGFCLENVYLVGSSVPLCMAWSDAEKNGISFDISKKIKDLDFALLVDEIPIKCHLPEFTKNKFVSNLFSRKGVNGKPDIDIRYYRIGAGATDYPDDIKSIIKGRDLTINMLLLDFKGVVWDCTGGKSFFDYDHNILNTYDEPFACMSEDALRPLRVISKLIEEQPSNRPNITLNPALEYALYKLPAPNWLKHEKLRKKLYAKLISSNSIEFLDMLQKFRLLGPAFNETNLIGEDLLLYCLTCIVVFCREHQKLFEIESIEFKLNEINQARLQNLKFENLKSECTDLTEEINKIKLSISKIAREKSLMDDKTAKGIKKFTQEFEREYNKTLEKTVRVLTAETAKVNEIQNSLKKLDKSIAVNHRVMEKKIDVVCQRYANYSKLFSKEISKFNTSSFQSISMEHLDSIEMENWDWDISEVTTAFNNSHDIAFTCFLALYLAYAYLYKEKKPKIAWYYFNIFEQRLEKMPYSSIIKKNLKNERSLSKKDELQDLSLEVLLQSEMCNINKSDLQKKIERRSNFTGNTLKILEELSLMEFAIKHVIDLSKLFMAIFNNDFYFKNSDFMNFISLYEKVLEMGLISESQSETIDNNLKIIMIANSIDLNKVSGWLKYLKKIKIIQMFPRVSARLNDFFENKEADIQYNIDLIKMSFEKNDNTSLNDKIGIFMQLGSIYAESDNVLHMKSATEYFNEIKKISGGQENKQFGFYFLWASLKENIINSINNSEEFIHLYEFKLYLKLFKNIFLLVNDAQQKEENDHYSFSQSKYV